jgi:hypothetical protein
MGAMTDEAGTAADETEELDDLDVAEAEADKVAGGSRGVNPCI